MLKGFRFTRLPFLMGVGAPLGARQALFPAMIAGGFLGQYTGCLQDYVHGYAARGHGFGRVVAVFLFGVAVGMGITYVYYPRYASMVDNLIRWLKGERSKDMDDDEEKED